MRISNKGTVLELWYDELWNHWNVRVADHLFSPDYRLHLPGSPAMNRDEVKAAVVMYSKAFPDLEHVVDEIVEEGDTVVARWTAQGTHLGDYQGIAPTGKRITVWGVTVHHVEEGRIIETWLSVDNLSILQQLGVAPGVVHA